MYYLEKTVLNPPNINTKVLSILTLLFFLSALLLGGYLVSTKKGQINPEKFTISQALAYGEKPVMITLFVLAAITTLLLHYLRGGDKFLLYLRLFLITVTYSLIIAVIYVTVSVNNDIHFKFAGTIFLCQLLVVFVVSHLINRYLDPDNNLLIPIDFNIVLIISSFMLLIVYGIFESDETSEFNNIVFASSENITVLLNLIPVIYLGFI